MIDPTRIRTSFDYPPIPDRRFDWSAVHDDYDGAPDSATRHLVGRGSTEEEARQNLTELWQGYMSEHPAQKGVRNG